MPHERDSAEMLGFCNKLPSASHSCVSLGLSSFCLKIPLALVSARPHRGSLLSLQSFLCLGLLCPGQSLVTAEEKSKASLLLEWGFQPAVLLSRPHPVPMLAGKDQDSLVQTPVRLQRLATQEAEPKVSAESLLTMFNMSPHLQRQHWKLEEN